MRCAVGIITCFSVKKRRHLVEANLAAVGPRTPSLIRKGALAALTGTDYRVLDAFVACLELYSYDNSPTVLTAARMLLARMQPSTQWIAKELIAFVFGWSDRERLWPHVESYKVAPSTGRTNSEIVLIPGNPNGSPFK